MRGTLGCQFWPTIPGVSPLRALPPAGRARSDRSGETPAVKPWRKGI